MLCDKCKKNEATVYLEQTINGEKAAMHLCPECALASHMNMSFNDMFQGFLNSFKPNTQSTDTQKTLQCKDCGMTYNDFRKTGRLGCHNCYQTFSKELNEIFKNIQSGYEHRGKFPKKSGEELLKKRELENMKLALKKCIENEEYEEAAQLRDKIKVLESGGEEHE